MVSEVFVPSLDDSSAESTLDTSAAKLRHYKSGASFPFNFYLLQPDKTCGGVCFQKYIDAWMADLERGMWPNYVVSAGKSVTTNLRILIIIIIIYLALYRRIDVVRLLHVLYWTWIYITHTYCRLVYMYTHLHAYPTDDPQLIQAKQT